MQQVKFVGVATTDFQPRKGYIEQGFVAQVGGVTTLINEGETTIKPGDKVALGLNLKIGRKTTRDKGIPREKIRFCLVKAGNSDSVIREAMACSSLTGGKPNAADVKKAEAALKKAKADLQKKKVTEGNVRAAQAALDAFKICGTGLDGVKEFLAKYQQLNERVIGKAASYARPGDRLEVILQPRNPQQPRWARTSAREVDGC